MGNEWEALDQGNWVGGESGFANPAAGGYYSDLQKALTAGGATAGLSSTGGRALVLEDLESTLKVTTFGEKQFESTLFNVLKGSPEKATGLVHEFIQLSDYGETGAYAGEISTTLNPIDVSLGRQFVQMRFARTKRQVSKVTRLVTSAASHETVQVQGGTRFLISQTENTLFEGDSTMVLDEFDGLHRTARLNGGIINLAGAGLGKDPMNDGALNMVNATGIPSHLFMPLEVQSHLDRVLVGNQDRVTLYNGNGAMPLAPSIGYGAGAGIPHNAMMAGAPIAGFRSSYGDVMFKANRFIKRRPKPFKPLIAGVATEVASSPNAPATPTTFSATASAGGGGFTGTGCGGLVDASGKFSGVYAGTYFYRVSAENSAGESIPCVAASAVAASTGKVTLVWDRMAGATCYRVYRSRNGAGTTDTQFIVRVTDATALNVDTAVTYPGGNTVQWIDTNQTIAGCFTVFMLDLDSPGQLKTLDWVQLAPMFRDMLPPGDTTFQWIQGLYGAICVYAPAKLVAYENVGIN